MHDIANCWLLFGPAAQPNPNLCGTTRALPWAILPCTLVRIAHRATMNALPKPQVLDQSSPSPRVQ